MKAANTSFPPLFAQMRSMPLLHALLFSNQVDTQARMRVVGSIFFGTTERYMVTCKR